MFTTAISLNRGFAFVQYDNEDNANEAIKNEVGRVYQNRKLGKNILDYFLFNYKSLMFILFKL